MGTSLGYREFASFSPVEQTVPERPPARWNLAHVERRLVEAFQTLRRVPMLAGPREFGTAWPGYGDEWAQQIAAARSWWMGLTDAGEVRELLGPEEWGRVVELASKTKPDDDRPRWDSPTRAEIAGMEAAIAWPGRYLLDQPILMVAVGRIALAKALSKEDAGDWVHKKFGGVSGAVHQGRCWAGCSRIAWGLERDGVAVF